MDHLPLWLTIIFGVLAILGTQLFMARILRDVQESLHAIMQGQEHIGPVTT